MKFTPLIVLSTLSVLTLSLSHAQAQVSPKSPFSFEDLVGACNTDGMELSFEAKARLTKRYFRPDSRPGTESSNVISAPDRRQYSITLAHNARQGTIGLSAIGSRTLTLPGTTATEWIETIEAAKPMSCDNLKAYTGTQQSLIESVVASHLSSGAQPEASATDITVRFNEVPAFKKIREEFKPAQTGTFNAVRQFCGNNPKAAFKLSCKLTERKWSITQGQNANQTVALAASQSLESSIQSWAFYVPAEQWKSSKDLASISVPTLSETTTEYQVELTQKMPCAEIKRHETDSDFWKSCGTDLSKWQIVSTTVNKAPESRATLAPSYYKADQKLSGLPK